jgi:lipopolysaccharide transport system permease protein
MLANVGQLIRSKDLVWSWTRRTIQSRYQQSVVGGLWMIIQPAAMVAIFTVIFTRFVPVDTGGSPYAVFSYVAVIPWTFFSTSLNDMATSMVVNMSLVTKIYFPREALSIAAMLARLLDFTVAAGLLVVLMLFYRVQVFPLGLLYIPVILLIQIVLVLGLGLLMAALNVFYRDVQSLLGLVLQLWFYASPIIYPVSMVPSNLRPYYFFNPMAGILESYRAVLINQTLPGDYLLIAGLISLAVFLGGYWFFKRVEFQFADIV